MKIGDVVTFVDPEHRFARWFLYQIGVVEKIPPTPAPVYCRVRWIQPVPTSNGQATYSDLEIKCYEVHQ